MKGHYMYSSSRKGWLAVLFIIVTLSIPFALVYYVSTPYYKDRYQGWRNRSDAVSRERRSKATSEQVMLVKDEKIVIGRTCLVFKGLADKKVNILLYLLDLDPEVPYPLSFPKKTIHQGVWLGNNRYSLLSVTENVLKLKIQDSYQTF